MPRESAGLLMYRTYNGDLQVLLAHPGGPYYQNKDDGWWSIPKGEIEPGEEPLAAARREFAEETGIRPTGPFHDLGVIRQKGGKRVHAWAFSGDCDPASIVCNTFILEWPPRSGRTQEFPEIDRAEFFNLETARRKINPAQAPLLDALAQQLQRNPLDS